MKAMASELNMYQARTNESISNPDPHPNPHPNPSPSPNPNQAEAVQAVKDCRTERQRAHTAQAALRELQQWRSGMAT